jgi:hypothetical protein
MGRSNRSVQFVFLVALSCTACVVGSAQTGQPALTTSDIQYFTGVFSRLDTSRLSPTIINAEKDALTQQFGLNTAEVAAFASATHDFGVFLQQLDHSLQAVTSGKSNLSDSDLAALSNLLQTRDQQVTQLVSRLLVSVRPEVAARLRLPGKHMASLAKRGGN